MAKNPKTPSKAVKASPIEDRANLPKSYTAYSVVKVGPSLYSAIQLKIEDSKVTQVTTSDPDSKPISVQQFKIDVANNIISKEMD